MESLRLLRIKEETYEAERDDSLQGKGNKRGGKQAADHAAGEMAAGYGVPLMMSMQTCGGCMLTMGTVTSFSS